MSKIKLGNNELLVGIDYIQYNVSLSEIIQNILETCVSCVENKQLIYPSMLEKDVKKLQSFDIHYKDIKVL